MENRKSLADIDAMANAAEYISFGDILNIRVRTNQDWALLPNVGLFSSVAPVLETKGVTNYPGFP